MALWAASQGDAHRRPGRQAHHPGLGEAVGEVARGGEQQDEGQQDQGVDDGGEQDLGIAVVGLEQGVLDDDLVAQVDEGIEEHHADEGQEASDAKELPHGPRLRKRGWAQWRIGVPGREAGATIPDRGILDVGQAWKDRVATGEGPWMWT